jgi:molybdenum cofactor synthesis domain-containing protein
MSHTGDSAHHPDVHGPGAFAGREGRAACLVLTISDGVSAGTREDRSGAVAQVRLAELGFDVERVVVPDDQDRIAATVIDAAARGVRLVVSSGGTGLGPRDRTPEALAPVIDYVVPGIGEAMRAAGRRSTPLASLSRSFAAVAGSTLIVCLPGSPDGVADSLDAIADIVHHALEAVAGRATHPGPWPSGSS